MKTKLMIVAMVTAMSMSAPAAAGLFDWMLGKAVENVVEDAVIDALMGGDKAQSNKYGKGKTKSKAPAPVASAVEKGDHLRLPLTGSLRFPVPKGADLTALEVGSSGGYLDRFGSEWIPYRANGRLVAWRSNFSERGRLRMAGTAGGQSFVLVGRDGKKINVGK